jgi:sensor histidine kinase YesM
MSLNFFRDFMLQLAFITTLIFTYQIFFAERSERKREKIILAVLFGLSILLCMTFPAPVAADYRIDIRIIPLLLGTLYGGPGMGIVLSAIIILYRWHIGVDLGLYTTISTLLFSMPVIMFLQKYFTKANKRRRIQIAFLLLLYYSLVGIMSVSLARGLTFIAVLQIHYIHIVLNVAALFFFITLNETIKEMIRKNQQLQSEAMDAEISFLRSQIKPHFLYNALNSIAALCIDEPRKAQELTLHLSQYLRSSFHFKQLDSLTTIEHELELVKAYISIEKARFGARLSVEYDVDADPDILIPPLILQPLVENAIRHGLMSNLQGGTVKIYVNQDADAVVNFAVEDNGCGMSEEKLEEVFNPDGKKNGIGLWNIRKRYQILYGKSIRVESAEGKGTKIFFDIPIRPGKQEWGLTHAASDNRRR